MLHTRERHEFVGIHMQSSIGLQATQHNYIAGKLQAETVTLRKRSTRRAVAVESNALNSRQVT